MVRPVAASKVLLVEGKNDLHVVANLCEVTGLPDQAFWIKDKQGHVWKAFHITSAVFPRNTLAKPKSILGLLGKKSRGSPSAKQSPPDIFSPSRPR